MDVFHEGQLINNQRPVNWILWSEIAQVAVIVIPEEAEALLAILDGSANSKVNLMCFAAPITRKMLHFNNFKFFSTPSLPKSWQAPMWLRVEVGILSGKLYFEYEEYAGIKAFLGVEKQTDMLRESIVETESTLEVQEDEAKDGAENGGLSDIIANITLEAVTSSKQAKKHGSFTKEPLMFLQEWISLRRNGQDFSQTPMGYVCQGKPLYASHPFFAHQTIDSQSGGNIQKNQKYEVTEADHDEDEGDASDGDDHFGIALDEDDVNSLEDDDIVSETEIDTQSSSAGSSIS